MEPTNLPLIENRILDFWRENNIFDQTVAKRDGAPPFVFYDGPPFTSGLPHYGHIMQMANKDAVLRYKTMRGYNVPRTIGWDTHGLPVEYQLEKELGLKGKKDIEAYGIEKFVQAARDIVLRCTDDWKSTMERMGRWVDTSHPYTTMDNNYMESVWWAFKQLYDKGLIYHDFRVSPYCSRCGTVVSNFEVNLGYHDNVADPSVYVEFPLVSAPEPLHNARLLVWTTTPWTLPSNVAVAVNSQAMYAIVKDADGRRFVLACDRVQDILPHMTVVEKVKGQDLVGLTYVSLYDRSSEGEGLYKVVDGKEGVVTNEGTGVLHVAPAYGEFDFSLREVNNLPLLQSVEKDGTIARGKGFPGEGLFVKEADAIIIADLQHKERIFKTETIHHTYPFCWRCDTPLLYYPAESWFVAVTKIRDRLVEENKKIHWQPEHLRDGRFGKWLDGARDWAISRDRFWGAPLPVWQCNACMVTKVIASRTELGLDDTFDLHRPYIDSITVPCPDCMQPMVRVPFVFDCWFESGSMPYAHIHYPFENKDAFDPSDHKGYPANFIAEALDQTRGWFYTLHVLGVGLFNMRAYENVVVTGLILAQDGKKLSKKLRNFVDPNILFEQEGVDALRLFLFTTASLGEDYRFSDKAVSEGKRRWIIPLLNVLQYYQLNKESEQTSECSPHHALLDSWILARVAEVQKQIENAMDGDEYHSPYDLVQACRTFGPLIEDLSTWYVRLSRGRQDSQFTKTLQSALRSISMLYAPFMPFVMEALYQELGASEIPSVHMLDWQDLRAWQHESLIKQMTFTRDMVTLGRDARVKAGKPVRQPLNELQVVIKNENNEIDEALLKLVAQELQVGQVTITDELRENYIVNENASLKVGLDPEVTPELESRGLANGLRRTIQDLRKQVGLQAKDKAYVMISGLPDVAKPHLMMQLGNTQLVDSAEERRLLIQTDYDTTDTSMHIGLYQ